MQTVWRAYWQLTSDVAVAVRIYALSDAAFVATLAYPSLVMAGQRVPPRTFLTAPLSWRGVVDCLTACGLVSGWRPGPPPEHPPRLANATGPLGAAPPATPPSRRSRRLAPHLATARRTTRAATLLAPPLTLAAGACGSGS